MGAYENCPGNITGETLPGLFAGTVSWTPPTILDRDPDWTEIVSDSPGDHFLAGTTNVTYRLTDFDGTADVCWFLVKIIGINLLSISYSKSFETKIIHSCPVDKIKYVFDRGFRIKFAFCRIK